MTYEREAQRAYDKQAMDSDIIEAYREMRINEEIKEMENHEDFITESIENFTIANNGLYRKLITSAWKTGDDLEVVRYLREVHKIHIAETAEMIVDREIENLDIATMKRRLDKREDVINHDVITLVKLA